MRKPKDMGNLSIKSNDEQGNSFTSRSPLRNRNIKDMKMKPSRKTFNKPTTVKNNLLKVAPNNVERQRKLKAEAKKSDLNSGPTEKARKKVQRRKNHKEEGINLLVPTKEKEKKESIPKNVVQALSEHHEKQNPLQLPAVNDTKLISDVLTMIVDLEKTFLEEKTYQRRLRTSFSKQNERLLHLEMSLHVEKERNKRLMELLSHGDSFGSYLLEGNNNTTKTVEKHDDLKTFGQWPYHGLVTNSTETPISPMLLQQRNDELQSSLLMCQRELKRKDNLLTLALGKQETLQAKCDKLTEEYHCSQRKLKTLNRKKVQHKWKRKSPLSETSESKESVPKDHGKRSNQGFEDTNPIYWDNWENDVASRQPIQFDKTKEE